MRHISSHHLEQMLRIAFNIDKNNHCPTCGWKMASVGKHSPECPPNSITIEMECENCRERFRPFSGFRAIMTNNMKVVLECY